MRKVKIILIREGWDYDNAIAHFQSSISDWEEITDEDYKFLSRHMHHLVEKYNRDDLTPVLIEMSNTPIKEEIKSIKDFIEKEKEELRLAEEEKQRKANERRLARLAKNKAQELELLEELKKKYPEVK